MDINTTKQYRNLIFAIMGISFIVSMIGLVLMISTRGEDGVSIVLTKVGIVGILASYFLSLYVAVMRRKQLAKTTKILLLALIAMSVPIIFGLTALIFN